MTTAIGQIEAPRLDTALDDPSSPESNVVRLVPPLSFSSNARKRLAIGSFPDAPKDSAHAAATTINNVEHLMSSYGITARYNLIKKKTEVIIPGHAGTDDNLDNVTQTEVIGLAALNGMATGLVASCIDAVGDRHPYNPAADWILSRPWDGEDRREAFFNTVVVRDDFPLGFRNVLLVKWLLSAVAAALKPKGFRTRGVLTLQGPQSIGKTAWCMSLVSGSDLAETLIKADHHLDGNNKDSLIGAIRHWIVEVSELDGSLKRDIARLKGFLTNNYDKVRLPYGRGESEFPRRTVFVATVNDNEFLVDSSGNTRFWTLPVASLNYEHTIDMQQLFAQLAVDFEKGAEWWLSPSEEAQLETFNRSHQAVSVIRDRVLESLDLERIDNPRNPAYSLAQVLQALGFEHPTNGQLKECANALRDAGIKEKRLSGYNKWPIPFKMSEMSNRLRGIAPEEEY